MKFGWRYKIPVWMFLFILVVFLTAVLKERSSVSNLKMDTCESEAFRNQELMPELYQELVRQADEGKDLGTVLTVTMLCGNFCPRQISQNEIPYLRYKKQEFFLLKRCYEAIWADIQYFPVPSQEISFENTWLAPRTYGGKRFHEGCDLFGQVTLSGYYPIVSMTDGTIEQIGWLPLGGYRIGIRSEHGGYFYYAHLSDYEKEFRIGDTVMAGDILGYMGNTGYGPEGTKGQFPVHLHLGIYISTPSKKEMSVNPYWILQSIHKNIINYSY